MKTQCPDPFPITDHLREWAAQNTPKLDLEYHTEEMVDFYLSHGRPMLDWNRTWYRWMRNTYNGNYGCKPRFVKTDRTYREPDPNVVDIATIRAARAHGVDPTGMTEAQINHAIWEKEQAKKNRA